VVGAALPCPAPAREVKVRDSAPVKRCPAHPIEQSCVRDDGVPDGPRWVWDEATACATIKTIEHQRAGLRDGPVAHYRADCAGKGGCRAWVAELGRWRAGKQHGVWQRYDARGAITLDANYQDGKLQGWWRQLERGAITVAVCYRRGVEVFRGDLAAAAAVVCPEREAAETGDGTVAVDDAQRKASRLVTLAQAAKNPELRVRYLRRACELVPTNTGYRKLLEVAEADLERSKAARAKTAPAAR
jgi:hypothetical protein